MFSLKVVVLILVLIAIKASAYEVSYKNHTVIRCNIKNQAVFDKVIQYSEENLFDIWAINTKTANIDLNLNFEQIKMFENKFDGIEQIKCETFIQDLQAAIEEEVLQDIKARNSADPSFFTAYRSYPEILTFMQQLASNYSFTYLINIGNTTQGTPIWGLSMNGGDPKNFKNRADMPTIYFQAGQHAREWIAPATVCYIMDMLCDGYGKNGTITKIVDSIQWIFVPVLNIDGYSYSRSNDRMWRKNRRNPPAGSTCYGVDTNRNWPAHWNNGGSSSNPCSDTYMGISSGSEIEVNNVVQLFKTLNNVMVATDWHSYSQMYLFPFGWTTQSAPDKAVMMDMGNRVAAAIRSVENKIYEVGASAQLLYIASVRRILFPIFLFQKKLISKIKIQGGFDDWPHEVYATKYPQTIELRDTGRYGFLLPASEIVGTGKENFNGVVVQALELVKDIPIKK